MADSNMHIRALGADEVQLALDWAAAEGWNPGLHDAAAFHAADPHGFFVGALDGQPAAVISAVRYGADYGFIGLYIVRPELRGRGHGWALWQHAMAHLAGRTIGLDGVVAQQDNYRRSGFVLAHRNMRFEGVAGRCAAAGVAEPIAALDMDALAHFDAPLFGAARPAFLAAWLAQPGTVGLAVRDGAALAGYGVIRPCQRGYKIGALFAATPTQAGMLLGQLCAAVPPQAPVFLDVPQCHAAAVDLAQQHGMQIMFETARMYAGPPPALPLERIFGITSFELG